jgi:hypothetical protein
VTSDPHLPPTTWLLSSCSLFIQFVLKELLKALEIKHRILACNPLLEILIPNQKEIDSFFNQQNIHRISLVKLS